MSCWRRKTTCSINTCAGNFVGKTVRDSSITSPPEGAVLSGTVAITANVSNATRIEFYLDGVRVSAQAPPQAPSHYDWNTILNPLPPLTHPMTLGYYYVEWKVPTNFDNYRKQVNGYTDVYYASLTSYGSDDQSQWIPLLTNSLQHAQSENRKIHLNLELNRDGYKDYWDEVLTAAKPYWNSVVRVEIADEPDWSRETMEYWINASQQKLRSLELPDPPQGFGATTVAVNPVPGWKNAIGLSWVGIEAYLNAPGNSVSQLNVDSLIARTLQRMSEVPSDRKISLVMQAYDRNGCWKNMDTLRDLQIPTFLLANQDNRVISVMMFAYARESPAIGCTCQDVPYCGGSRFHPELKPSHRLISERIFNKCRAGSNNGRRTITVMAYDTMGNRVFDSVNVTVANPSAAVAGGGSKDNLPPA